MPARSIQLRSVTAARYVAPLREGGSLPGLMEADDEGLYVVKFRGAGQGSSALIAEVFLGELARALGLPIPEIVLVDVSEGLALAEGDPEIQELIRASAGINMGIDFLPGAFPVSLPVGSKLAADIVWFDALITNVDRTAKNPNLLYWHNQVWLIDHGACIPAQHSDSPLQEAALRPFPWIEKHVLLDAAGSILEAHERNRAQVTPEVLEAAVGAVPADWFSKHAPADYADYIRIRLEEGRFATEAEDARA